MLEPLETCPLVLPRVGLVPDIRINHEGVILWAGTYKFPPVRDPFKELAGWYTPGSRPKSWRMSIPYLWAKAFGK